MRYDKNGLPIKEYYTEELKKSPKDKMKELRYQKYYTGGAIILMILVLISMYLVLKWKFIVKKHTYECPAVSAFPIDYTHIDFQKWINEQTKS